MRTVLVALLAGLAFTVWALGMLVLANLLARVGRYRSYRRLWPAAGRGSVWRHVR